MTVVMSEYRYLQAWRHEIQQGLDCGILERENRRVTLRIAQMTFSEYEAARRNDR